MGLALRFSISPAYSSRLDRAAVLATITRVGATDWRQVPPTRPERRLAAGESFSLTDLSRLEEALEWLLEYESSDWPSPERHAQIERINYLLHEVRKRLG